MLLWDRPGNVVQGLPSEHLFACVQPRANDISNQVSQKII